jgi:hypothetical protein
VGSTLASHGSINGISRVCWPAVTMRGVLFWNTLPDFHSNRRRSGVQVDQHRCGTILLMIAYADSGRSVFLESLSGNTMFRVVILPQRA